MEHVFPFYYQQYPVFIPIQHDPIPLHMKMCAYQFQTEFSVRNSIGFHPLPSFEFHVQPQYLFRNSQNELFYKLIKQNTQSLEESPITINEDNIRNDSELINSPCVENDSEDESDVSETNLDQLLLAHEVKLILLFFVDKFGIVTEEEIVEERARYYHNQTLLKLFDSLVKKYISAFKGRGDTRRFIMRKALSSIRNKIRKEEEISAREASLKICKRYFKFKEEELAQEIDMDNEDEVLNYMLPYKENSRNKTANTNFINEIFISSKFRQDFSEFLENLNDILEEENQKRTKKFLSFLRKCTKENNLEKIKKYTRLPWLKLWNQETIKKAYEINAHMIEKIEFIPKETNIDKKNKAKKIKNE